MKVFNKFYGNYNPGVKVIVVHEKLNCFDGFHEFIMVRAQHYNQ